MQVREVSSGAAKREAREKLLEAARRREIDVVLVQPPYQHDVDLPAAGGLQYFLASFSLRRSRAHLADLHDDHPAAPGSILPHGAALHGQRLLIIRGNAGV